MRSRSPVPSGRCAPEQAPIDATEQVPHLPVAQLPSQVAEPVLSPHARLRATKNKISERLLDSTTCMALVDLVPAMDEATLSGAVPPKAAREDTLDVLDQDFGIPVRRRISLERLNSFTDAVLCRAKLGLVRRSADNLKHVGRRAKFDRVVDKVGQVRRKVVPKKHTVVIGPVRGGVLLEVTANKVNERGEVDLIHAALAQDSVPNARLCHGPKAVIRYVGVTGFDGENDRNLLGLGVVTRLPDAQAGIGPAVLAVAARDLHPELVEVNELAPPNRVHPKGRRVGLEQLAAKQVLGRERLVGFSRSALSKHPQLVRSLDDVFARVEVDTFGVVEDEASDLVGRCIRPDEEADHHEELVFPYQISPLDSTRHSVWNVALGPSVDRRVVNAKVGGSISDAVLGGMSQNFRPKVDVVPP
jgi:hypothetical protein